MKKCNKGWHDGTCCCNCKHQKKIFGHPFNKNQFTKTAITKRIGYGCSVALDEYSTNRIIFMDSKHGMCEMHSPKNK